MSIKKNEHPWEYKFKKPMEKYQKCQKCDGVGKLPYLWIFSIRCSTCKGTGKERSPHIR